MLSRRRRIFFWLLGAFLVAGLLVAGLAVDRSLAATGRVQVILQWGGGPARAWDGRAAVSVFGLRPAGLESVWLMNFEPEDNWTRGARTPMAPQHVPTTLQFQEEPGVGERLAAPLYGADLHTRTDGEADGLSLLWVGARSAEVVLDFGDAQLEASLVDLLEAPVVVDVDGDGNHLLARAIDLEAVTDGTAAHFGQEARRVSLHTHTSFSTATVELDGTLESLPPFVRDVWWTDHNLLEAKTILGGDFEDPDLTARFWVTAGQDADVDAAGFDREAHAGAGAFRLTGHATGARTGRVWTGVQGGERAGELNASLVFRPRLRFSWQPVAANGRVPIAYVEVEFASGRRLRYLSGGEATRTGVIRGMVLSGKAGEYTDHERDLHADLHALFPEARTDSVRCFLFGVFCAPGAASTVRFDELSLELPAPADTLAPMQAEFAARGDLRSFAGMEQTAWMSADDWGAYLPHLTALLPEYRVDLLGDQSGDLDAAQRRAWVRRIQDAGGIVGTHHMQRDNHYTRFLADGGYGVDLFEIGSPWGQVHTFSTRAERRDRDAHGYPARVEQEVYPLLVRWDRTTSRGFLLTGYGAPDLNGRFDTPSEGYFNRWLSWVLCDADTPGALLDAIRRGQVVGGEWFSDAIVTLHVDGRPWMGQLIASDQEDSTVEARVSGVLPGSRLRWIVGRFQHGTADPIDSARDEPPAAEQRAMIALDAAESAHVLEVKPAEAEWVRAEVLDPTGHLVAFSNPVAFLPYWPSPWPRGKVAFDWQEHRLVGTRGVCLEEARVEADGALFLQGRCFEDGGSLTLQAPARPRLRRARPANGHGDPANGAGGGADRNDDGALRDDWDAAQHTWTLSGVPAGDFAVTVELGTSLSIPPRADPDVVPPFKQWWKTLPAAGSALETDRFLEGFSAPTVVGTPLRRMARQSASFQMALPADRTVWLRLRELSESNLGGKVEMNGRELGRFDGADPKVIEVPPQRAANGGEAVRTFTIVLDQAPGAAAWSSLRLLGIDLFAGPGVLFY